MRTLLIICLTVGSAWADIQAPGSGSPTARAVVPSTASGPVVSAPTMRGQAAPTSAGRAIPTARQTMQDILAARSQPRSLGAYPWKFNITATVFWIGEQPTQNNPVPNTKSSWDASWQINYGGYDDPDPGARGPDFRPKSFIPRQNPFYVALPFNDVERGSHKAESAKIIPWFQRDFERNGQSVCKGKWVQIVYKNKYCFAQWEDCGPFTTEDWQYVFGNSPPQNKSNKCAGIDISPSVRDYLGIDGGTATVHWRFVEFNRIPYGPWAKYGENNPFVHPQLNPLLKARQAQLEQLKRRQKAMYEKLQKDTNLRRQLQG